MWIFCVVFYLPWIVTRTLSVNRFHSNYFTFYVIIYHLTFSCFFLMSSSWQQLFSLSTRFVNSTHILTDHLHWFLLAPISRDVTRIKITFKQFTLGFIFFSKIVISRIYFPWKVIGKKYFSWSVMRTLSPIHLCESAINLNSFSNIYFFTIIRLEFIYILYRNNWFSSSFCSM